MTNPSSSNSNAYFHVYYSLDGGNTWSTRVFVTIQPGGTDTPQLVPDGQRIRWKYYPRTEEIEPTDVVYVELPDSEEVDCAFDTIPTVTMGTDCASDGTATSNYQIKNNHQLRFIIKYSTEFRVRVVTLLLMRVMS